ncbi:MAG: hypothetical protein GY718_09980 [Lentisphaerae bacterium]|nr:hypothetical protein [Lentisphaerota bacterium]
MNILQSRKFKQQWIRGKLSRKMKKEINSEFMCLPGFKVKSEIEKWSRWINKIAGFMSQDDWDAMEKTNEPKNPTK